MKLLNDIIDKLGDEETANLIVKITTFLILILVAIALTIIYNTDK